MKVPTQLIAILWLSLPIAGTWAQEQEEKSPTELYAALVEEFRTVSGGMRTATTDLQRKEVVERMAGFPARFIELAEKHPGHQVAIAAIQQAVQAVGSTDSAALNAWEMNKADFPTGCNDDSAAKSVALVLRDFVDSEQLGPVIDRMRFGYRMDYQHGLRTLLENNSHRSIQGLACLSLAQNLNDRLQMLQLVDSRPELITCYERVFGKDYLDELNQLGQVKLAEQAESYFQRAIDDFGDIQFRSSTVGEVAKFELHAIRNLAVGKIAPEMAGKDQDGMPFQLSDYRGQVVLVYFWSEY